MIVTIDVIELGEKYLQRIIVPTESKINGHLLRGTESFSKIVTWLALARKIDIHTLIYSRSQFSDLRICHYCEIVEIERTKGERYRFGNFYEDD